MAGISSSPLDPTSARGPPPPPPWMQGPAMQNGSGPPPALQPSISAPLPPHRPALGGSANVPPPPGYGAMQFRPVGPLPPQPKPPFVPASTPQFRPVAPSPSISPNLSIQPPNMLGMGPPMQPQTMQFPQGVPLSQGISFNPPQRPLPGPIQVPQVNFPPLGVVRVMPPPSFTYANQNFGVRPATAPTTAAQLQSYAPPPMVQPWNMASNQAAPVGPLPQTGQTGQQNSLTVNTIPDQTASDWQEHSAPDGRRYYYNKRTKQSSWEKPVELMTPVERADASTAWKEFTAADGRKYYYNKETKQSKWTIPEEMKLAREKALKAANPANAELPSLSPSSTASAPPVPVTAVGTPSLSNSSPISEIGTAGEGPRTTVTEINGPGEAASTTTIEPNQSQHSPKAAMEPSQSEGVVIGVKTDTPATPAEIGTNKIETGAESKADQIHEEKARAQEEPTPQGVEESKKAILSAGNVSVISLNEDKPLVAEEGALYSNKAEAKNAFKELLESVHVASDWTWEQAMRVIINDKRYGALKTLGERKQTFNEFLAHRKKQEIEEKRARQKKARDEFIIMLQESKVLSSKMRWSKVVSILAEDPRFRAVEKDREREELFEDYLIELEAKEKERAREERKKNLVEYRKFLESCEFIKANTQWRKVADRLEVDERCTRLSKTDRLDVFQEYVCDLERILEEELKKQKEQERRRERANRDDFRKLLEEHRASGLLTVRVTWWDYIAMVKDHPVYMALCQNTSGATAKELFEDAAGDMAKQYSEDKNRIKDFIKSRKIILTSDWTLEEFKASIHGAGALDMIFEANLKFIFEDLLQRAKEKEEKEAKMKKKAVDDFSEFLHMNKSITASSSWGDCKEIFESIPQFRIIDNEALCKTLFDEYVLHLQQKAKEKERKREEEKERREKERERDRDKGKEKEKKDKEREREKYVRKDMESQFEASEFDNSKSEKEHRKKDKHGEKGKHRDKKHKRHHQGKGNYDMITEKSVKDESKKSHRHGSSEKKKSSRKHGDDQASDGDHINKRQRGDQDLENDRDLEDGELGTDSEYA